MNKSALWVAFSTLLRKETRRFLRIWPQTLLPPAITMSLYFVIFGNLIGGRIGEMGGFRYIEFIVPGLIMMSVITNSYSNVCSSFFSTKFQRSIEELLCSPIPNHAILLGYMMGGVARGLCVGAIVMLVSLFFTQLHLYNVFVIVYTIITTSALFALGGFINAVYARSFDDISIVPTFILTPLTYLGGVFYSIEMLSPFWQKVSLFNPIVYMVNAFRFGILGHSDINVWMALAIISISCIALYSFAYSLLARGIGLRN